MIFIFAKSLKLSNQIISTSKTFVLIVLFCTKCEQLSRFKAGFYRYFVSLEFCEIISDKFLSFILHLLFYTAILIYFLLHVMFSLNLKIFSYIFSYIYAFCNHKVLPFFFVFSIFIHNI